MDTRGTWARYRHWLLDEPELGFRLDVSRMNLPDDLPQRHEASLTAALAAMKRLEAGEIANPDEGRQVGHYWLRAPELAPDPATGAAIRDTVSAIRRFAEQVHAGKVRPVNAPAFDQLLVIGIGGSALGPQFVAEALGGPDDRLQPWFFDNTDPDGLDRVLARLGDRLASTLAVVISKSGGTPETRNGMLEAAAAFSARGLEFGRHAVAVTGEGSKLDRYAKENRFIERFPMWDWIGGRTSELAVVGLLPAALQGFDVQAMLDGAAAMDRLTRRDDPMKNPAALLALAWHHAGGGKGERAMVVLPYKDRLALFSRYLQQLVMESLGKELDLDGRVVHQGIAVYGNKGSTDQHAYVQQLREGRSDFFATFIEVLRDREGGGIEVEPGVTSGDFLQGFLIGTRQALHEAGRPSLTVTVEQVSPNSIGMLIALYERAVGLYASMVNVNAYHQPGVEAGKKAAAAVLDLQRAVLAALDGEPATCEALADRAGAPDQAETVFLMLERLSRDARRGIVRQPGDTPCDATYRKR